MRALILAAGRGERMRPLTDATPKPLLRAAGKRLIEWQIESLTSAGVRDIVINVAHLPDEFESALGDGRRYGVALHYSREGKVAEDALESLGGIVKALPQLGDAPFIVTSGDIVTDFPYGRLAAVSESLLRGDIDAHLVLVANPAFHFQGDMGLLQEPTRHRIDPEATPRLTYANIGIFAPRLFTPLLGTPVGTLGGDGRAALFPWLYGAARAGRVNGETYAGRWWNAGTPEDLARVDTALKQELQCSAAAAERRR